MIYKNYHFSIYEKENEYIFIEMSLSFISIGTLFFSILHSKFIVLAKYIEFIIWIVNLQIIFIKRYFTIFYKNYLFTALCYSFVFANEEVTILLNIPNLP